MIQGNAKSLHIAAASVARTSCLLIVRLFLRDLWRTTLSLSLLWFAANFASGWWTWMPEFAKLQCLPSETMYTSVTVARTVAMAAFVLAAALIKRVGPRHDLNLIASVTAE